MPWSEKSNDGQMNRYNVLQNEKCFMTEVNYLLGDISQPTAMSEVSSGLHWSCPKERLLLAGPTARTVPLSMSQTNGWPAVRWDKASPQSSLNSCALPLCFEASSSFSGSKNEGKSFSSLLGSAMYARLFSSCDHWNAAKVSVRKNELC